MTIGHAPPRIVLVQAEAQALSAGLATIDWTASGLRIYCIGPDISSLARAHVPNENIVERTLEVHRDIPTLLSGVALPFQTYIHGSPLTAAEGAQAAIAGYPLTTLIKNAIGGGFFQYVLCDPAVTGGYDHYFCDEDGKFKGFRRNVAATALSTYTSPFDELVGDVLFCKRGGSEGDRSF
jgi:hypothetical protein